MAANLSARRQLHSPALEVDLDALRAQPPGLLGLVAGDEATRRRSRPATTGTGHRTRPGSCRPSGRPPGVRPRAPPRRRSPRRPAAAPGAPGPQPAPTRGARLPASAAPAAAARRSASNLWFGVDVDHGKYLASGGAADGVGVTGTIGITDADERLHPVEDPSPHWSDSLYFNAWDPGTDTFLMTRIAVLGNEGRVTGGMIVWVGGELAYGYGRELDEIPPTDWDVMSTDGLTYRMLESGQAWAVQLADGEAQGAPRVARAEPGRRPTTRTRAVRCPRRWRGATTSRAAGSPATWSSGGHTIAFDGFGQRDHSWGFRHWAGLHQWHWVTGFLVGRALLQPVRGAHPRRHHHRERLRPRPRRRRLRHRRRPRARAGRRRRRGELPA